MFLHIKLDLVLSLSMCVSSPKNFTLLGMKELQNVCIIKVSEFESVNAGMNL
jgi:hypothetical protein